MSPEASAAMRRRFASMAGNLVWRLFGLAATVVLAHTLGPVGRGIVAEAVLWPTLIVTSLAPLNFQAATYFASRYGSKGAQACLVVAIAGALVLLPLLWTVNWFALGSIGKPSYYSSNIFAVALVIELVGTVFIGAFLAEGRVTAYWVFSSMPTAVSTLAVIMLAVTNKLHAATYASASVFGAAFATLTSGLAQRTVGKTLVMPEGNLTKAVAVYGTTSAVVLIPYQLNVRLDQLMLSLISTPAALGQYAVAIAWASSLSVIGAGFSTMVLTRSAQLELADQTALQGALRELRLVFVVVALGGIGASLAAPIGIPVLFGSSFRDAVGPGMILCLASAVLYANAALRDFARGLGFPGLVGWPAVFGLVVSWASLVVLLPKYGASGAAASTLAGFSATWVVLVWQTARLVPGISVLALVPSSTDVYDVMSSGQRLIAVGVRAIRRAV